jgi:hypothetical protein
MKSARADGKDRVARIYFGERRGGIGGARIRVSADRRQRYSPCA